MYFMIILNVLFLYILCNFGFKNILKCQLILVAAYGRLILNKLLQKLFIFIFSYLTRYSLIIQNISLSFSCTN